MTPAEQLARIRQEENRIRHEFRILDHKLATQQISTTAYHEELQAKFDGKQEHELLEELRLAQVKIRSTIALERKWNDPMLPVVTVLAILGLFAFFLLPAPGDSLTGFVAFEPVADVSTGLNISTEEFVIIPLNITRTTSLKISGAGYGAATLIVDKDEYLIYSATKPKYSLVPTYQTYALNDLLNFTVQPAIAHTLWLTLPSGDRVVLGDGVYPALEPGIYTADALINDSGTIILASAEVRVRQDANSSKNAPFVEGTHFVDKCIETCDVILNGNMSLSIEPQAGETLSITEIVTTTERANTIPIQNQVLPGVTLNVGETAVVDLSPYFSDNDGDILYYDYMNTPGLGISVTDSVISITGIIEGSYEVTLYVSDLYELVQSDPLTVTVTKGITTDVQNETTQNTTMQNVTILENQTTTTEDTENNTGNESVSPMNETIVINTTLDCTNPNPNERPLGCVQAVEEIVQPPQIYLEDLDRKAVARITPIGNLMLTGTVIENAIGEPRSRDFRVDVRGSFGTARSIAWITDGSFYVTGKVYEEVLDMKPPQGAYTIQNSQSITVAYIDRSTGDLYVRGNIIQGRSDLG